MRAFIHKIKSYFSYRQYTLQWQVCVTILYIMRLRIIAFALCVFCTAHVLAQTNVKQLSLDAVPPVINEAFKTKFPQGKSPLWYNPRPNVYRVVFNLQAKPLEASFDNAGKFTGYMAFGSKESLDSLFKRDLKVMMH